jgi:hypothetical protein
MTYSAKEFLSKRDVQYGLLIYKRGYARGIDSENMMFRHCGIVILENEDCGNHVGCVRLVLREKLTRTERCLNTLF